MLVLITGWFNVLDKQGYTTGKKEFVVSHAIDYATGRNVIVPCESPDYFGAERHAQLNEWVVYNNAQDRLLHEFLDELDIEEKYDYDTYR